MSDVINKTTFQYLLSVNTPDYSPADWVINPDLSNVVGVPQKYWKVDCDSTACYVIEMSQAEKDIVDFVEITFIEDATESTTTSDVWQDKLTLVTGTTLSGPYDINWNFKLFGSVVSKTVEARVYNVTDDEEYGFLSVYQNSLDERRFHSGFIRFNFDGTEKTFKIQWRIKSADVSANICDVSLAIGGYN